MGRRIRPEDIYAALLDDDALAQLPDILTESANARSALMLWQHSDGVTQNIAHSRASPTWFHHYAGFAEVDPYRIAALRPANLNRIMHGHEHAPPEIFLRSTIYNELILPHGDDTVHCIGSGIRSAWGHGIIGVHRGRTQKSFDAENGQRLASVIVHVERVLRVRGEIASMQRSAALSRSILDTIGLAAIAVRANGFILQSNAAAEAVLRRADGLLARGRCLTACDPAIARRLAAAMAQAAAARAPVAAAEMIERGPDDPAYLVTITPLIRHMAEPAALVVFRDPDAPDHSLAEHLRTLFRLTRAEAALAVEVANGLALADIARRRGVKVSTLRAQLKAIGVKTGCSRQSELAVLLHRLPPG